MDTRGSVCAWVSVVRERRERWSPQARCDFRRDHAFTHDLCPLTDSPVPCEFQDRALPRVVSPLTPSVERGRKGVPGRWVLHRSRPRGTVHRPTCSLNKSHPVRPKVGGGERPPRARRGGQTLSPTLSYLAIQSFPGDFPSQCHQHSISLHCSGSRPGICPDFIYYLFEREGQKERTPSRLHPQHGIPYGA